MEKFNRTYGHYPKYPVADAGYGSYNNYLYCEEHGMEKYMKFTMYKKETTDKKYHENPYRAVNFAKDAYLLRNRKVNTKKRQNRHLPELAFLILGTYFTAPFRYKSDRRGSNPRSRPWQGRALPTTPLSHMSY